jgi:hypothetical protein
MALMPTLEHYKKYCKLHKMLFDKLEHINESKNASKCSEKLVDGILRVKWFPNYREIYQ